jgi:hypothetical protein
LQGVDGATLSMGIVSENTDHAQPSFLCGFPIIDGGTLQLERFSVKMEAF